MSETEDIKKEILDIINNPKLGYYEIKNDPYFYFEKARQELYNWLDTDLSEINIDGLLELLNNTQSDVEFRSSNQHYFKIAEQLTRLVAYCDTNARGKKKYNEYADKRVLAKAGVRQNDWYQILINLRVDSLSVSRNSVTNAANYLEDPISNCTILSENHRRMVAENLMKIEYSPEKFVEELKKFFAFADTTTVSKENYTHWITRLTYRLDKYWREEISGLVTNDGREWQRDWAEKMEEGTGVIWWNKKPGKAQECYKNFDRSIAEGNVFNIYYAKNKTLKYEAVAIDYATKETYPQKVELWREHNPYGFEENFEDYYDNENRDCKIAFLINSFKSISNHIGFDDITFYKEAREPVQNNLVPFFKINEDIEFHPAKISFVSNSNTEVMIPINQILYGPPGTGKTYSTVLKSLAIVEQKTEKDLKKDGFSELKKRYDQLVKSGQIVFTTFHQSMGYEDFVEGIKPQAPKKDGEAISYKIESGIFKQISLEAKTNLEFRAVKQSKEEVTSFDIAFRSLEDKIQEALLEEPDDTPGSMKRGLVVDLPNSFFSLTGISGPSIRIMNRSGNEQNTMTKSTLQKIYDDPDNANHHIKGGMLGYYKALVNLMLDWKHEIVEEAKEIKEKIFVLVIDEINRGNVSAIFGELITLLEESKRFGNKECIEVTLPYSKDTFSVPKNLYIIGTMNTADRSVEALDVALRRRFHFEVMMPKPQLLSPERMIWDLWWKYEKHNWDNNEYIQAENALYEIIGKNEDFENNKVRIWDKWDNQKNEDQINSLDGINWPGIKLNKLLSIINERISFLKDEDHQIGHSYFMNISSKEDLADTFNKNIIPLLQEYFYNDYSKIRLILGDGFVQKVDSIPKMAVTDEEGFLDSSRYALQEISSESILDKLKITLGE
ncbi:MAG: AAA family ATPase [Reichenbachiella sp.]|uniref:McrB family protein n=1 Tax=Reichenbachiella sp. TaxID=2184521 RepID=UPI003299FD0F